MSIKRFTTKTLYKTSVSLNYYLLGLYVAVIDWRRIDEVHRRRDLNPTIEDVKYDPPPPFTDNNVNVGISVSFCKYFIFDT